MSTNTCTPVAGCPPPPAVPATTATATPAPATPTLTRTRTPATPATPATPLHNSRTDSEHDDDVARFAEISRGWSRERMDSFIHFLELADGADDVQSTVIDGPLSPSASAREARIRAYNTMFMTNSKQAHQAARLFENHIKISLRLFDDSVRVSYGSAIRSERLRKEVEKAIAAVQQEFPIATTEALMQCLCKILHTRGERERRARDRATQLAAHAMLDLTQGDAIEPHRRDGPGAPS